jgi:putative aminopeptidase FrvX
MTEPAAPSSTLTELEFRRLRELTECVGVSGGEADVRAIVRQALPAEVDEVQVDALGNLIVVRRGRSGDRLRVMVAAHMDEVGIMIVAVDDDGRLHFEPVAGIREDQLAGRAVWLGPERIPGVIGVAPPHLTKGADGMAVLRPRDLRIDIGADSRSEALARAAPGTLGTWSTPFECQDGVLRGKALDDRLGVATLIGLLEHSYPGIDLVAVFTTQEEVGLRGAGAAAHRLAPDLAIAIDCTPARDFPLADGKPNPFYNTRLGEGPALYVVDGSTVSEANLLRLAESTARQLQLPFQLRQPGGGSTDAAAIHRSLTGIPSLSISVPGRNLHGSVSTAQVSDWQAHRHLVRGLLQALSPSAWAEARSP